MSKTPMLGKLSPVDPKTVWEHEASSFTPWLATAENLQQLSDAIGIELDLETARTEVYVGPFKADIVCEESGTKHLVIFENQLEKTDHSHLGQLITYATGLDASIVVWISPKFTEEHRASLDWLNRHTKENLNFFGVQLEVWQIGSSERAPKFHVVSQPNDYTKTVSSPSEGAMSPSEAFYLSYWTAFRAFHEMTTGPIKLIKPSRENWISKSPFGHGAFNINLWIQRPKKQIGVSLYVFPDRADQLYPQLRELKADIETVLGPLTWFDEKRGKYIMKIKEDTDPTEEKEWPAQHRWLLEEATRFYEVFMPIIREM